MFQVLPYPPGSTPLAAANSRVLRPAAFLFGRSVSEGGKNRNDSPANPQVERGGRTLEPKFGGSCKSAKPLHPPKLLPGLRLTLG